MTEQAELERDVFRRFAEIAPMAIALESVQNRMPPEPDILCKLQSGKSVAFELVEVCNPKNAKLLFSAHRIVQAIEDAFAKLPEDVQHEFRARFTGHPLSFHFRHEASLNQVRANLPEILTELAAVQERDYEFVDFAPELRRTVVRKVRSAGRQHNPNGMNFNIGGEFDPTDVTVDAVELKLKRTYSSEHPIELLAYHGAHVFPKRDAYVNRLRKLFQSRGLGPFRRVWVLGWEGIDFVYPE